MKRWTVAKLDRVKAQNISEKYDLPAFFSILLTIRNISSESDVNNFLENNKIITDPFQMKDMEKAVLRIRKAIDAAEKICVYGDYDADGVTATCLLFSYLRDRNADVMYYIPKREEGYGMNTKAVDTLKEIGIQLIITVDNGIAAVSEIDYAASLNIDVIVTDHHKPQEALPEKALALIDMHQKSCKSTFKEMSGVGVAFMMVQALEGEFADINHLFENFGDLLAIGTVGDIVPLILDNRVFVKKGLVCIQNSERCGITALLKEAGFANKPLTSTDLAFSIVPRINAVGRLETSEKSLELLLTEDYKRAEELAVEVSDLNRQRQDIVTDILEEINIVIENKKELIYDRVIVVAGDNWHHGVIGIVSAKLKDRFDKPVIIISTCNGISKGSGRSVKGFSLCDAVASCGDILIHYGGHPMAAGLELAPDKIDIFRKKINQYAKINCGTVIAELNIECKLNPANLDLTLAEQVMYLEPFGEGNPLPVFGLFNMMIETVQPIGNNKHLRLTLKREHKYVTALYFFMSADIFPYIKGDLVDLAVTLDINEYQNKRDLSIIIRDIKFSDADVDEQIITNMYFETVIRDEILDVKEAKKILPKREEFAEVYKFIKNSGTFYFSASVLCHRLGNRINYGKIMVILEALNELNLVKITRNMKENRIDILPVNKKVDLEYANIIKRIKEMCQFG